MNKNWIWFGPPGSGKSWIIDTFGGIDLEDMPADERRASLVALNARAWGLNIGAADTQPSDYDGTYNVRAVLLLPEEKYRSRRRARDEANPSKASQPDVYAGFVRAAERGDYDIVLADTPSIDLTTGQALVRL